MNVSLASSAANHNEIVILRICICGHRGELRQYEEQEAHIEHDTVHVVDKSQWQCVCGCEYTDAAGIEKVLQCRGL
jgi:hypothetical protein